ncbi:MAG: hypothetical protein R3E54_03380 [Halioglobus sp.]
MSGANRRYYRSILLGVAAMAALVWAAMDQFGISRREIGVSLLGILVAVAGIIVLAGVCAALWIGLRRLLRGDAEH